MLRQRRGLETRLKVLNIIGATPAIHGSLQAAVRWPQCWFDWFLGQHCGTNRSRVPYLLVRPAVGRTTPRELGVMEGKGKTIMKQKETGNFGFGSRSSSASTKPLPHLR